MSIRFRALATIISTIFLACGTDRADVRSHGKRAPTYTGDAHPHIQKPVPPAFETSQIQDNPEANFQFLGGDLSILSPGSEAQRHVMKSFLLDFTRIAVSTDGTEWIVAFENIEGVPIDLLASGAGFTFSLPEGTYPFVYVQFKRVGSFTRVGGCDQQGVILAGSGHEEFSTILRSFDRKINVSFPPVASAFRGPDSVLEAPVTVSPNEVATLVFSLSQFKYLVGESCEQAPTGIAFAAGSEQEMADRIQADPDGSGECQPQDAFNDALQPAIALSCGSSACHGGVASAGGLGLQRSAASAPANRQELISAVNDTFFGDIDLFWGKMTNLGIPHGGGDVSLFLSYQAVTGWWDEELCR